MIHHDDGSVTLNAHEVATLRGILDWLLKVKAALTFADADRSYVETLGLRGELGEQNGDA